MVVDPIRKHNIFRNMKLIKRIIMFKNGITTCLFAPVNNVVVVRHRLGTELLVELLPRRVASECFGPLRLAWPAARRAAIFEAGP